MEKNSLDVEITTPKKQISIDAVEACSAPGVLGRFQIMADHTAFLSELEIGELDVDVRDQKRKYAISGGFLEVLDNHILLLLESCESRDEIDVERARKAKERAERRLREKAPGTDILRAETALARAMNRLRVAEKVI